MGTIALKLLLVALYAWLYQAGGRAKTPGGKAIRRWVGTGAMVAGLYGLAEELNPLRALAIPFFFVTAFFGYGGEAFIDKAIRRLLFGLTFAAYALVLGLVFDALVLGIVQAVFAVTASLVFGLLNPDKAADEEALIGALSVLCLPFIVS